MTEAEALALLKQGEYGVLSLQAEEGGGYGVPVNYVWDGALALYIHCAPEGRKLRCLERCDRVSFCVVGRTQVVPERFTTAYESILLMGRLQVVQSDDERMRALELLLAKYSPEHVATGRKYAAGSFHRTALLRLDIATWSGKCKRIPGSF